MSRFFKVLTLLGFAGALATNAAADELFKADLSGDQEVPPAMTDASGMAMFRLDKSERSLEIQLRVENGIGITQSHIHCAPAGQNGPVVVFLAGLHAAGLDVDGKWVSNAFLTDGSIVNPACGGTIAELAEEMRTGNTYVNVHSLAVPSGEIRGQILPTGK
jgi:hypothetical protein